MEPCPVLDALKRPSATVSGLYCREGDDDYRAIYLSDAVRVIDCSNGLQWIVQRKSGGAWRGLSYCVTKKALLRYAHWALVPEIEQRLTQSPSAFGS
jgi:hypothetical protein